MPLFIAHNLFNLVYLTQCATLQALNMPRFIASKHFRRLKRLYSANFHRSVHFKLKLGGIFRLTEFVVFIWKNVGFTSIFQRTKQSTICGGFKVLARFGGIIFAFSTNLFHRFGNTMSTRSINAGETTTGTAE